VFSSEVDTGSHEENTSNQKTRARLRFNQKRTRSRTAQRAKAFDAMTRRFAALSIRFVCAGALALIIVRAPNAVHAQSADLVLCDRLAADPADPDKPADVKGVQEVAQLDVATAIKFCRTASAGSRRALYELGRAYAANRQLPEAIGAYRKAIDKGSTSAMVELGVLMATGSGLPKDDAQARKLFERAAEGGNARGITNLASISNGTGAPSDPVKARAMLSKAAETNSAEAQYQLGLMMADGLGGSKDDVGARILFEKAAAQGHPGALERMGAFAQSGRGGAQDSGAAKAFYEKAAALGNEDAKAALKRAECPYVIKDKRGNVVSNVCF
jgi:TPR repeat protein